MRISSSSESARISLKELLERRKEVLERIGCRGMTVQPRRTRQSQCSIIWPASVRIQIRGSKQAKDELRQIDGQTLKFWREKIFLPRIETKIAEEFLLVEETIKSLKDQRQKTLEANGGPTNHEKLENYLARAELDRDLAINELYREQLLATLERAEKGKLGICLFCGGLISEERLDALPCAFECIKCAEVGERKERRRR